MITSDQEFRMQPATKEDISRLESAIKEIALAVRDLILIDERQKVQGQRIGELEKQNASQGKELELLQRKVDSWINRGIGAWGVVLVLAAIIGWITESTK